MGYFLRPSSYEHLTMYTLCPLLKLFTQFDSENVVKFRRSDLLIRFVVKTVMKRIPLRTVFFTVVRVDSQSVNLLLIYH